MDLNQTWITLTVQAQRAFNFFLGTNSLQYTGWCKAKIILVSNYTLQLSVGMEIPQKISLLGESKNQGMGTTQLDGWES